jgi:hypothetical protein
MYSCGLIPKWCAFLKRIPLTVQSADIDLSSIAKGSLDITTSSFNKLAPTLLEVVTLNEVWTLKSSYADELNEWTKVFSEEKQNGTLPERLIIYVISYPQ